jgi:hypothetical protein
VKTCFAFIVAVLLTGTTKAQSLYEEFTPILLPITFNDVVPGAYGSEWTVQILGFEEVGVAKLVGDISPVISPVGRAYQLNQLRRPGEGPGSIVYVARPDAERISFALRVKDRTRQADSDGTEIPTVREDELFTSTLHLLNIGNRTQQRSQLRIYDVLHEPADRVRVRVFDLSTNELLGDEELLFSPPGRRMTAGLTYDFRPAYIDVPIQDLIAASTAETLRVEITPLRPGLRFWAFATVTNNQTQQFTTVTPQ